MSNHKKCLGCHGSGKVLGLGNMPSECELCEGSGKIYEIKDEIEELNIRHTQSYNNAIEEIKTQIPDISHEKAQQIFDDELRKVNKKGRK
jgi:DnaJ-class molecular chaperone